MAKMQTTQGQPTPAPETQTPAERTTAESPERRSYRTGDLLLELRAAEKGKGPGTLVGYAAVFNEPSNPIGGSFREVIAPGAFTESLRANDVVALYEHNPEKVLGRKSAKTLRLKEDQQGLRYEVDLPNTQVGRDVAESVKRGDIVGSSFAFRALSDVWTMRDGLPLRTLEKVEIHDVSPVTYPAYNGSSVSVRAEDKARELTEAEKKKAVDVIIHEHRERAQDLVERE